MKKCLLFVRTSTLKQETDSQLKETREYAESLGYDEFVTLNRRGSSAYKTTDEYLGLIEEMKETVMADPDIKAVVCWAMNRLFRNITVANELKEWFVEHRIQLEIYEPHIKLLEPDGTLSNSSEMVFYFFSVYNKQQIDELRKKSSRAKTRDKALHKFIGGRRKFGYRVVDKQVVPDEKEAPIVNDIFDLYATGEHSYHTTAKEINERYGTDLQWGTLKKMIQDTKYYDGTMYPPIITKEQYDRCLSKRDSNWSRYKAMGSKHYRFANRLIRCPVCGKGYTANVESYRCIDIDQSRMVAINNMDGLLWVIASHLEGQRLLDANSKDEYRQRIAVLQSKIASLDSCTSKATKRAERAKKMALEGLIEVDEYKAILQEVELERRDTADKADAWRTEIADLERLVEEDTMSIKRILDIADQIDSYTEQQMRAIVRKWVRRIDIDGDVFTVETLVRTYKAVYRRYNWVSRWLTMNGRPLAARPLNRNGGKCWFGEIRVQPVDLPYTIAWLGGSEIV